VFVQVNPRKNLATGKPYELVVFVDPWTGKILAHCRLSSRSENLLPLIFAIHRDLTLGHTGALVLGYLALVWTIDCFVSFYLTLPITRPGFWRRWRTAWWVKWSARA
jgi:uncharacterized iron-regulated membrane protein